MKKVIVALLVAVLVIALVPPVALARPDKEKPVPATNVELVKKITLHGKKPHPGGGKPSKYAATGELGELLGEEADRYAVVVGINNYPPEETEEGDLQYAVADAEYMATVLESYGFDVNVLIDDQATREDVLNAIAAVPDGTDEMAFVFSGHGARGMFDDGDKEKWDEAICTYDYESAGPIWDGELEEAFREFPTGERLFFFFDSCLAGGMEKDLKGPGRVIAMSTTEQGTAYEGDQWGGGHGQFSYYFVVEGMYYEVDGDYYAYANVHDYNGDGELFQPADVTVEEAYDYAKSNCKWQRPTISDSFENDLLL